MRRHCIPSHNPSASQAVAHPHRITLSVPKPTTYSTSIPTTRAPLSPSDHHQAGVNANPPQTCTAPTGSARRSGDTAQCPPHTHACRLRPCQYGQTRAPDPPPRFHTDPPWSRHPHSSSNSRARPRLTHPNLTDAGTRRACCTKIRRRWTRGSSASGWTSTRCNATS